MREISNPPIELLAALDTPWCERVSVGDDGEVLMLGEWIVVRTLDEDEHGDRLVTSLRAFKTDGPALEAFESLLEGQA